MLNTGFVAPNKRQDNYRELIVMLMFGYLGLSFPDIDLFALSVLHHRSIITHSILLPAIFFAFRNTAVRFGACGFILGISVHLAADIPSSPVGFGQVWLPWPVKIPLGPLSALWLAGNAIIGLVWAKVMLLKLQPRSPLVVYTLMAVVLAPSYAIFHEHTLAPLISFSSMFLLSFAVAGWMTRQYWFRKLPQPFALPPPVRKLTANRINE